MSSASSANAHWGVQRRVDDRIVAIQAIDIPRLCERFDRKQTLTSADNQVKITSPRVDKELDDWSNCDSKVLHY